MKAAKAVGEYIMKTIIVIPARLESRRLPRKLLLSETGRPLLQHTWEQAKKTGLDVVIATDSQEIIDACHVFGACKWVTSSECRNGTERVAEGLAKYERVAGNQYDVIVNWQADEPEVDPSAIHGLLDLWDNEDKKPMMDIASLMYETWNLDEANREDNTKVVFARVNDALYFSRSRIPSHACGPWWIHVGVYAYPIACLRILAKQEPCDLDRQENLEQLRWIYNHHSIDMLATSRTQGINTREDYDAFVQRQKVAV